MAHQEELELEIMNTKTEPLTPSSDGSIPALDVDGVDREYNPYLKMTSSQRKDFLFVTNMRKEVISIVEPFRKTVLTFEDRLRCLEKQALDVDNKMKDDESKL